jgi:hypothetical protein
VICRRQTTVSGIDGDNSEANRGPQRCRHRRQSEEGFSLIELLIVAMIMPLIVGALAVGAIAVFRLQSGVSNRLGDTADSQMISAVFSNDVSGALYVTTGVTSAPQCGAGIGTQLLGIEENLDSTTEKFGVTISYVRVRVVSGATTTYNLERLVCAGEGVTSPTSTTTLAYDFSGSAVPTIVCTTTTTGCPADAATKWMPTLSVSEIILHVTEPATGYSFTLGASPVNSSSSTVSGSPISTSASTACNAALPNTGSLSATLCFVDFAPIYSNSNDWALATDTSTPGSCLPMSASVGRTNTLYFCLHISGAPVKPSILPTYSQAFLGNLFCLSNLPSSITIPSYYSSSTCLPFYTGIAGSPAFYQSSPAGQRTLTTTTLIFSNISLVGSSGAAATGWHVISADAESTDAQSLPSEWMSWTADQPVTPVCNGEFWDSCTTPNASGNLDYWGNACLEDQAVVGLIQVNANEIKCVGGISSPLEKVSGGPKSGTAIVQSVAPTQMTIVMSSPYGGLEGVAFGLTTSGVSS